MMDRFIVKKMGSDARGPYAVVDTLAGTSPEHEGPKDRHAVIIRFRGDHRANTICNLLNAEWREFVLNPD